VEVKSADLQQLVGNASRRASASRRACRTHSKTGMQHGRWWMPFDQPQNLRDAIRKKKPRIAEIEHLSA
jgi:hypothetical protein